MDSLRDNYEILDNRRCLGDSGNCYKVIVICPVVKIRLRFMFYAHAFTELNE